MATTFADFGDYDTTVYGVCVCGAYIYTPGAKTCKACKHNAEAAAAEAAYQARKLANHRRYLAEYRKRVILNYVAYLRRQVERAVRECV